MRLCNWILALAIVPFFRSLFSSVEPDETDDVAKPFSRADILFNQSVDKLAILFEENKGEKGCHLISMTIDQADKQIISIYYLYLRTHYTF